MLNASRDSTGLNLQRRAATIRHEQRPRKNQPTNRPASIHSTAGASIHSSAGPSIHSMKSAATGTTFAPAAAKRHPSKRALDAVLAAGGLLMLWPLMLVIGATVVATSRGGALFKHERIGRDGRPFTLYKFRSMRAGTSERVMNDPVLRAHYQANNFKLEGSHEAITRVGRLLRKSSLDELPQLWNVLIGEMSLVGVRPLVADELATRSISDQQLYISLPPGLTGLWQVEGRSAIEGTERTELDRRYVEEWSFWNDVRILARTPLAVLRSANTH